MDQFWVTLEWKRACIPGVGKRNSAIHFQQSKMGLFYFDTILINKALLFQTTHENGVHHISLIQIVVANKAHFEPWEIKGVEEVVKINLLLLHPSQPAFDSIVTGNLIQNLPITVADIQCANNVYGPSVPVLKWQTTQKSSDYIHDTVPTTISKGMLDENQNGILCIDFST